jgi:hypothetical protein
MDLDDLGLLAADVAWSRFLPALHDTSEELFEVRGRAGEEWLRFVHDQDPGADYKNWHLVGGELDGHSYVLAGIGTLAVADRITALAAATGGIVFGYNYLDITADAMLTAARGSELLRYVYESNFGSHSEGNPLPGEPAAGPQFPVDFDAILRAHGFDADGWLDHGDVWAIGWTQLDAEASAEAHHRVYFGPLRMRVDHIEQAALLDMMGDDDDEL